MKRKVESRVNEDRQETGKRPRLQKVNSGERKGGTILLARQLTYRVLLIKTRNKS